MEALKLLNEKNLRLSGLRIKILEYILENKTHPTIEEIYEALIKDNPTLSKTTVYNTTKMLSEHNLITQILIDDKQARYDGDVSNHAHFMCEKCNKIYDFEVLSEPKINLDGFEVTDMKIYCRGICNRCKTKK